MKTLKIAWCLVILTSCAVHSQKSSGIVKIEFTTLTRGHSSSLQITPDSIYESVTERGITTQPHKAKVKKEDWESLIQSLEGVTLSEIPDLPSPTMKRAYDGAKHSTISITTSNGKVLSHSFDDEYPHEKLQSLMKAIVGSFVSIVH